MSFIDKNYNNFTANFVTRATLASADISCRRVSVCPSVCLSVRHKSMFPLKRVNVESRKHDRPGTLVFWCRKSLQNSNGVTPSPKGGVKCTWG